MVNCGKVCFRFANNLVVVVFWVCLVLIVIWFWDGCFELWVRRLLYVGGWLCCFTMVIVLYGFVYLLLFSLIGLRWEFVWLLYFAIRLVVCLVSLFNCLGVTVGWFYLYAFSGETCCLFWLLFGYFVVLVIVCVCVCGFGDFGLCCLVVSLFVSVCLLTLRFGFDCDCLLICFGLRFVLLYMWLFAFVCY